MEGDTHRRERQAIVREKIIVDLPPGEPTTAELVWGKLVGDNRYEIANVPIWVFGLAYGDVVEADTREDGRRHFKKVLDKGGLLTVRAAGPGADRDVFDRLCEKLQRHAVATERFSPQLRCFRDGADGFRTFPRA